MSEQRDELRLGIRKAIAAQRQAFRDRVAARDPSPEAFILAVRRRREAFAALMRRVGTERPTPAELDRMIRFGDRCTKLLERRRR